MYEYTASDMVDIALSAVGMPRLCHKLSLAIAEANGGSRILSVWNACNANGRPTVLIRGWCDMCH